MEVYVKITRAGDSPFKVGSVTPLSVFILMVGAILKAGGDMPTAIYQDEH